MSESTPATTKSTAAKAPAKRTTPANRAPAKQAAAKKAPAKKAAAKKAAVKKTPAKKRLPRTPVSGATRKHPYRTLAERVARGTAWRDLAPIEGLAAFEPAADRPSALAILQQEDAGRIRELVPLRYGRMSASAFAFYRGSAVVMAYDLAQQPRTGGRTQLCGDAHLANFGLFGSPERDLVFDVNDFDETLPGPFEWDVKRLAASVVLAGRDRGFKKKESRAAAVAACEGYRTVIQRLATAGNLEVWYTKIDATSIEDQALRVASQLGKRRSREVKDNLEKLFTKARSRTSARAAERLTETVDGRHRFREDPPLLTHEGITAADIRRVERAFVDYKLSLNNDRRRLLERFDFVDVARKVVGVGSVGTRALVLLFQGRDVADPLVLQVKQAEASVLEAHLDVSQYQNHGQRVVEGQRYMQATSDIFLGWVSGQNGYDFYVRQLHDMKGSVDLTKIKPDALAAYGRLCGATLARAHARGGDVVAIASYLGDDDRFSQGVARFGEVYAKQAERDYAGLMQAIASGDLKVTTGL